MTSTQRSPHTVREQLNEANEKQSLFEERSSIGFLSTPHPRTSYHTSKDWVMYWINLVTRALVKFQQKKISLSTIGLNLKSLCRLVLAPGMTNSTATVLFLIFVPEIDSNTKKVISLNITEMNQTIMVIFAIQSTYIS